MNANMIYLFAGIIIATPIGKWIAGKMHGILSPLIRDKQIFAITHDIVMVGLFMVCVLFLVGETFNPFIFFRF